MRKSSLLALIFGLTILGGGNLFADLIPKIGVVDVNAVYRITNTSSSAVQRLQQMKDDMVAQINQRMDQIRDLKQQRVVANSADNTAKVTELDATLTQKQTDLQDYRTQAQQQLNTAAGGIRVDADFLKVIQTAVSAVANKQGYSIVLTSTNSGVVYWSNKVDITSEVADYITRNNINVKK